MRNYKYFWSLLPGLCTIWGNYAGGWWVLTNLIFSLVILAGVEWFFPEDNTNEKDENSIIPDMLLAIHVLFQVVSLSVLVYSIQSGRIVGGFVIGAALSTGIHSGSSSIVIAHELIHRRSRVWQFLGKLLLFSAMNVYFFVEHLRVHHKWVGTERDPATARRGESLYFFFVRSAIGQARGAWKLETERLKKEGRSGFNLRNFVLASMLLLCLLVVLLYFVAGWTMVFAFLVQGFFAHFLLEYTNYIEHYGLKRSEKERTTEHHSWQTDKVISRFVLIDLSRHADHHYYASKPYHTLLTYKDSPVLPGGYASALYLALLPPLWYKVIHRRLDDYTQHHA